MHDEQIAISLSILNLQRYFRNAVQPNLLKAELLLMTWKGYLNWRGIGSYLASTIRSCNHPSGVSGRAMRLPGCAANQNCADMGAFCGLLRCSVNRLTVKYVLVSIQQPSCEGDVLYIAALNHHPMVQASNLEHTGP